MADNVELNAGSGGAIVATDQVGTDHYQLIKLAFGALDTANLVTSTATNPLPVALSDTDNAVLDSIKAAVEIMDDWDESDRAKVNPIVGQAGIAAGAGAVGVTVPRVTLASDDPAVALLGTIDTDTSALAGCVGGTELQVDIVSGNVTNAGTFAVQVDGAALTALQLIDDAVYTDDVPFTAGSNKVIAAGFRYDDTVPDGVTEGDVGYARMSAARELYAVIRDAAGNERGLNVDASGAIGVTNAGLTELAAAINSSRVDVNLAASAATVTVDLGANNDVTIDGSSVVKAEDAAHSTGDTGIQALAVRNDSDASLCDTTGDYTPLQVDANGYLKVNIKAGAGSGGTASTDDAAFTAGSGSGTPAMGFFSTDTVDAGDVGVLAMDASRRLLVSIEADNVGIGGGTQYTDDTDTHATGTSVGNLLMAAATPTDGAVDANDIGAVAMSTDRRLHVDAQIVGQDADITIADGGNTITVDGTVTANLSATDNAVLDQIDSNTDYGAVVGGGAEATALRVTIANDSTGVLSIDDNSGSITVDNGGTFAVQSTLQTGSALVGDVGISGARTSGGTTLYKNIDVDESEDQVKATAGQVYWIAAYNLSSGVRYLKLYNATAASVTVGTTTPTLTFPIPTQGDTNGAGFVLSIPNGIAFSTAITVAATTGVGDADSGAPGANEVVLALGYA